MRSPASTASAASPFSAPANTRSASGSLRARGKLDDVSEFEKIIVKTDKGGRITRLQDVARVELGAQQYSQTFKLDQRPSAGLALYQLPHAHPLRVAPR